MNVTVAICTWNRSALLARTLERMTALTIPPDVDWELLVIDNNCTDDTVTVAGQFADRLPVRIEREPSPGVAYARNRALRAAKGDYILFTDDDVLVEPDWIARFAEAVRRFPSAVAFGGRIEPWFPEPPDDDFLEAFEDLRMGFCGLNYDRAEGPLRPGDYVYTANMGLRRAGIGGLEFNKDLGPSPAHVGVVNDDTDFVDQLRRRGLEVIWVPAMMVRHYVEPSRMTLGYLLDFAVGKGRTLIRSKGVPMGVQAFGVPRWLVRKYLEARAHSIGARVMGRRVHALTHLRHSALLRGMIFECRRLHRARMVHQA
jgi:glycosyltransferase involved in cell wall biosynthesis